MDREIYLLKHDMVAGAVQQLLSEIKEAMEKSTGDFTLDFQEVLMIDSKGLGLIITLNKILLGKKRKFILINLNDELKELLALTRLNMHLEIR